MTCPPTAPAPQPESISPSHSTLYDVILPGTHDSASYATRPDLVSRTTIPPLKLSPIRAAVASVQTDFARTQSLSILEQLRAGARFLDIRVTKRPASAQDKQFWTHHGMVLCVPLRDILQQINCFHDETSDKPLVIVTVFRPNFLTNDEQVELADVVRAELKHDIFHGTASDLRRLPITQLPPNIVAGLHDFPLDIAWGKDPWLDTYSTERKINFLSGLVRETELRNNRDNLLVVGWTITPGLMDIVCRVFSLGLIRSSVLSEAEKMNALAEQFIETEAHAIRTTTNVIFFDGFSKHFAHLVNSLNATPPSSDSDESATP